MLWPFWKSNQVSTCFFNTRDLFTLFPSFPEIPEIVPSENARAFAGMSGMDHSSSGLYCHLFLFILLLRLGCHAGLIWDGWSIWRSVSDGRSPMFSAWEPHGFAFQRRQYCIHSFWQLGHSFPGCFFISYVGSLCIIHRVRRQDLYLYIYFMSIVWCHILLWFVMSIGPGYSFITSDKSS